MDSLKTPLISHEILSSKNQFFLLCVYFIFVIHIEKSFSNGSQINGKCLNMHNSKNIVRYENFRNQSMKLFNVVGALL